MITDWNLRVGSSAWSYGALAPRAPANSHGYSWTVGNYIIRSNISISPFPHSPGRNFLLPGSDSATMSAVAHDPQSDATDVTSSSTPVEEPEKKKRQYKDFGHDDEKATRESLI
jgi:hypothetical protein